MDTARLQLRCASCGSPLAAQAFAGHCPSCGHSIRETLNPDVVDAGSLTVGADLSCTGCEYNLRTLAIDGTCPECGLRVVESLRGDDLRFADPSWLQRVARGCGCLRAAVVAGALAVLLMTMGASLAPLSSLCLSLGALMCVVSGVLWITGIFWATAHEPLAHGFSSELARRCARACTVVWTMTLLVLPIGLYFAALTSAPLPLLIVEHLLPIVLILAFTLSVVSCAIQMERLLRRARRLGWARVTRTAWQIFSAVGAALALVWQMQILTGTTWTAADFLITALQWTFSGCVAMWLLVFHGCTTVIAASADHRHTVRQDRTVRVATPDGRPRREPFLTLRRK